jgi:hypothetical protein
LRTLLKKWTAAGWLGTQWRQEKEVTREKDDLWLEQKAYIRSTFKFWDK